MSEESSAEIIRKLQEREQATDPYAHPPQAQTIPGTLESTEPPPRFLDIPVGIGSDRRLASIPFEITASDYDMIVKTMALWRERLITKP